nr:hypothetical protein B0A51_10864 [Rachicladosporium sp. CCFEE 5018]
MAEPDVHHSLLLEQWIVEDAEKHKRKLKDDAAALQRAAGIACSSNAGAQLPLIDVSTGTGTNGQTSAAPLRGERRENSTDSCINDASPSAKLSAHAQLRTVLAKSPTNLRGLLSLRAPYLEDVPASFRDSMDRDLIAQLPGWMQLGPRNVKYSAGRLENGCHLIQIPGQLAMHRDLERRTYAPLGGVWDAKIITDAAKRAVSGSGSTSASAVHMQILQEIRHQFDTSLDITTSKAHISEASAITEASAAMDPFLFALLFCVFVGFSANSYRTSRLNKEPPSARLVSGAFMILPLAIWSVIQFVSWRRSEAELDICWLSLLGALICWCLVLWGCFTEDEVYQYPPRHIEPLKPRTVTAEVPAATTVKETRESEGAAAPTEVKRTQKRQDKPWVMPGCSSVHEYGTWKRTELTPGHAPTSKPSIVRRQPTIVPRHKYSSYSHLLAQPSLASSFGQVSHRETPTSAARPQKTAAQEQITANLAARKAALSDPYTPQQPDILFPVCSSADILSALQPSDRAHVVTEWLRLSAVVMETMDKSPLFNTGFANSAATHALRTDRVLRGDFEAILNRFTSLLGWVTHGTSLFWDLSRLDAQWIEQRLSDIAVRRFGVAMVGMMKIDVQSLSKKDLEELDSAATQELAKAGQVNGANGQQCGQSYGPPSMTEQAAPRYQPADGASLAGGAGKMPQTSGGGAPAGTGSFTSNGSAPTFNSSAPAASSQQQPATQSTAPSASFSTPTSQQTGAGNPAAPAFFTASSSQQASTSTPSSSAQPVPAATLTQPAQTQAHPQTQSTKFHGLAASRHAPQNYGTGHSQAAEPSGTSTSSASSSSNSAAPAVTSGASQVAGASSGGLIGHAVSGSASSVNGTPDTGVSTSETQSARPAAGGLGFGAQSGRTAAPLTTNAGSQSAQSIRAAVTNGTTMAVEVTQGPAISTPAAPVSGSQSPQSDKIPAEGNAAGVMQQKLASPPQTIAQQRGVQQSLRTASTDATSQTHTLGGTDASAAAPRPARAATSDSNTVKKPAAKAPARTQSMFDAELRQKAKVEEGLDFTNPTVKPIKASSKARSTAPSVISNAVTKKAGNKTTKASAKTTKSGLLPAGHRRQADTIIQLGGVTAVAKAEAFRFGEVTTQEALTPSSKPFQFGSPATPAPVAGGSSDKNGQASSVKSQKGYYDFGTLNNGTASRLSDRNNDFARRCFESYIRDAQNACNEIQRLMNQDDFEHRARSTNEVKPKVIAMNTLFTQLDLWAGTHHRHRAIKFSRKWFEDTNLEAVFESCTVIADDIWDRKVREGWSEFGLMWLKSWRSEAQVLARSIHPY